MLANIGQNAHQYAIFVTNLLANVCLPYPLYPCGHHANQTYYGPCPEKRWDTPVCRKTCRRKYPKSYEEDKIFGE
ncbi:hypothetical protein ANCCEY_08272 [Ancylostoma ceylanicum]|uniref:Uncharacterized protein n=1 Tax=Ancylostoma ceylanicum TaxID=53326 RepID=A0A0D6LYC9_9BILA|nr:hypothetical protein ANCCEY_08272 [Ancylostoma ceylanicum]